MDSARSMDASVYRLGEPQLQDQCTGLDCAVADILTADLLFFATLTVTFLLFLAAAYLRTARDECDEERSRVRDERDALGEFKRRIEGLQPATGGYGGGTGAVAGGAALARAKGADTRSQLREVQTIYEDTVMSVPHYEADYGEPLAEHMAVELGEDVAVAVLDGDRLTPQIKQALVSKSAEARRDRQAFFETLDEENNWLKRAHGTFDEIDADVEAIRTEPRLQQSFSELQSEWERLDDLEGKCADVIERRQRHLDDGAASSHWREDGHSLCQYLYGPMPVTYPVLAEGTLLLDRIRTTKRRVVDSLTRRV